MDRHYPIKFNQELQWAAEMASHYVAAITNFIVREDNIKTESIDNPTPKRQQTDDYMKREDDIHNCYDLCTLFRQMGYIAYVSNSRIDGFPATVTVYNLPLTQRVAAICHHYRVPYIEYITPEKSRARIERWEDVNPAPQNAKEHKVEFEHTYTSYEFENFDLEDFGYLTMDLMHCTEIKQTHGLSVLCTIRISAKIEEALNKHWKGYNEEELLNLYAEFLNSNDIQDCRRRDISDEINEAIETQGLLETDLTTYALEKEENDKALNRITKSQDFIDYVINRAGICPQLYLDYRPDLGEHTLALCHKDYGYDGSYRIDDYRVMPLTTLEKKKGFLHIVRDYFKTDGPYTQYAEWDIITEGEDKNKCAMRQLGVRAKITDNSLLRERSKQIGLDETQGEDYTNVMP